MGILLYRVLRTALTSIMRNLGAFVTALLITSLMAFLITGCIFAQFFASQMTEVTARELKLSVLFEDPLSASELASFTTQLRDSFPEMGEVTYTSPSEAMDVFLSRLEQDSGKRDLAEFLREHAGSSALPATLTMDIAPSKQADVLNYIRQSRYGVLLMPLAHATAFDIVTRVVSATAILTAATYGVALLVALLSVLIVIALMRLTLASRAEEIGIMRLTGATLGFIRMPFLIEGALLTVLSTLLGLVAASVLIAEMAVGFADLPVFGELLYAAGIDYYASLERIAAWILLLALLIGLFGSFVGTRRYLVSREVLFG